MSADALHSFGTGDLLREDEAARESLFSRRLVQVSAGRLAFLLLLLTGTSFFYFEGTLEAFPVSRGLLLATIGLGFVLGAAYAAALRIGRFTRTLAFAQVVLDQCAWTILVYVSGGPTSGASTLYALTCAIAAVLVGRRGAFVAAATALLLYGTLCLGAVRGFLHPPADQHLAWSTGGREVAWAFLLNSLGIVAVAFLSGFLAQRLRATGGALAEARERARVAENLALLGRVAAGLAHEIRNPLGAISGSVELLREAPGLGEEDRALCDIVTTEVTRLEELVNDMMDLARPRPAAPAIVNVRALARDVVQLAGTSHRRGDVSVHFRDMEGASPDVYFDRDQLRQVLWNLVRNAIQASPAGGTVTVALVGAAGALELVVEDQGNGIDAAQRDKLFDPFFTTRTNGAGLGLAVVQRIVREHEAFGAKIRVEDTSPEGPSRGARFRMLLPTSPERPSLVGRISLSMRGIGRSANSEPPPALRNTTESE